LPDSSHTWRYETINLRNGEGWTKLKYLLSGGRDGVRPHLAVERICEVLYELSATAALVERRHHDRDFTAEFRAFHAIQFRPGSKECIRVHFFHAPSQDIDLLMQQSVGDERNRVRRLESLAAFSLDSGTYRGFCVVKPTSDVPIGFTVIARPPSKRRLERKLWSPFTAHVLGQKFTVFGFPFLEQDGRTGACAQASVWMALRHIWAGENGLWRSVPALNAVATSEPGVINSLSVPPGSGGLDASEMMRAVRNAERIPHYFSSLPGLKDGHLIYTWKNDVDPIAIACRYLDSNIPVILLVGRIASGLCAANADGQETPSYEPLDSQDGHALTAVGYYGNFEKSVAPCDSAPPQETVVASSTTQSTNASKEKKKESFDHLHLAQWVDGLIVHNDQAGPYLDFPRTHRKKPSDYNCTDILALIVPLPDEAFLRADKAEEYAWMFLNEMGPTAWQDYLKRKGLEAQPYPYTFDTNQLAARTFLVRGFEHYQWLARANAHNAVLKLAAHLDYSHFVWITEFYTVADGIPLVTEAVAHVVADATAVGAAVGTVSYQAFLFAHLPGQCFMALPGGTRGATLIKDDHAPRAFEFKDMHPATP
jgi:hypothetical protein